MDSIDCNSASCPQSEQFAFASGIIEVKKAKSSINLHLTYPAALVSISLFTVAPG